MTFPSFSNFDCSSKLAIKSMKGLNFSTCYIAWNAVQVWLENNRSFWLITIVPIRAVVSLTQVWEPCSRMAEVFMVILMDTWPLYSSYVFSLLDANFFQGFLVFLRTIVKIFPSSNSIVLCRAFTSIFLSRKWNPSITEAANRSEMKNVNVSFLYPICDSCFTIQSIGKGIFLESRILGKAPVFIVFYTPFRSESRYTKPDPALISWIFVNHFCVNL